MVDSESTHGAASAGRYQFTSGALAALLHVDLKTIHNWVVQGHLAGRRTQGRHLRFDRTEVVRFMRLYGYPLPEQLGKPPPRVVLDRSPGLALSERALKRGVELTTSSGLFEVAIRVARGDQEILILDLDQRDPALLEQFLTALRASPFTQGLVLVGISQRQSSRRGFLVAGGNTAIARRDERQMKHVVGWLTGGQRQRPPGLEGRS